MMDKLKNIYCIKVCRYFLCVVSVVFITYGTLSNAVAKENNVSVVEIGFLKQLREKLPKLSNLELLPDDDGVLGGYLSRVGGGIRRGEGPCPYPDRCDPQLPVNAGQGRRLPVW